MPLSSAIVFVLNIVLVSILVCISVIDIKTLTIPDSLWISIAILGLVKLALFYSGKLPDVVSVSWQSSLIGALAISVPLFALAYFTGGFGGGDIKLMFAAGIFLGWQLVILATIIGVVLGGIVGVALLVGKRVERKTAISFGQYLCAGIFVATFWGPQINNTYFSALGLM